MSYSARPYDGAAYGGAVGTPAAGGGVSIIDPANPTRPGYRWRTVASAAGAYDQVAFSGGGLPLLPARAGLSLIPDGDSGQVRIAAWWSDAPLLRLMRVTPDGVRTPVRGAYPATVGATRHNQVVNPSFESGAGTGWLTGANTTFTVASGTTLQPGSSYGQAKATAAGSVTLTVPTVLPLSVMEVSLDLKLSALPSGQLTAAVAWTAASGASMGSTSAATTTLANFVGRWDRTPTLTITPPSPILTGGLPDQAASGVLTISIAGMAAGATAGIDGVLVEPGTAGDGSYFDGDFPLGAWTGTAQLSASSLAPVITLVDDEAPLDVAFRYELLSPSQPGNVVVSDPVTLDSGGQAWLGHPVLGAVPIWVTSAPQLTTANKQGIYPIVGSALPIAVTAAVRQAATGTLPLYAIDPPTRDRLAALLADGSPLLLRVPGDLGFGSAWWLSVGDVVEAPLTAWGPRNLQLPFTVVAAPAVI